MCIINHYNNSEVNIVIIFESSGLILSHIYIIGDIAVFHNSKEKKAQLLHLL